MHQHESFGHYRSLSQSLISKGYQVKRHHIDIACMLGPHLDAAGYGTYHDGTYHDGRWSCCRESTDQAKGCKRTQFVVPAMHMLCHCESCQFEFGVLYQEGDFQHEKDYDSV
jgi:hypothetical protein